MSRQSSDQWLAVFVRRLGAVGVLLLALFGLLVWHGTLGPAPALGAFPSQDHIGGQYERYVGDEVEIAGHVVETHPLTVEATYDENVVIEFRIVGLDQSIDPRRGELLRVYGVAQPDRTINARSGFTVSQSSVWYTWSISFLAGLWVLSRIVQQWRFNTDEWALEPRREDL